MVFVLAIVSSGSRAEPPAKADPAAGGPAADAALVLDGNSLWRQFHLSRNAFVRHADGQVVPYHIDFGAGAKPLDFGIGERPQCSPLPPADWADPAFDDSSWPRVRLPQPVLALTGGGQFQGTGGRTFFRPYDMSVVLVRGTFEVGDPAQVKSCKLSLDYWGGAVAYLNGREVARGHLPGDKHDLMALAEDYPLEAFTTPDGKPLPPDDEKNRDRLALRDRTLRDVAVPPALLRKGANVLAIAVHTAVTPRQGVPRYGSPGWPPVGLVGAQLSVSPPEAAAANASGPRGIRVWNCAAYDTVTAFDYGAPAEPVRPVVVRAARNGVFSGRLLVGSDQAIKGLKVSLTDLAQPQVGAKIPAAAVRVRYAEPAVATKSWAQPYRFDGLLDAIPAEIPVIALLAGANRPLFARKDGNGLRYDSRFFHRTIENELNAGAVAPLWFTVRVPRNAQPGVYEGTVGVTTEGMKPVTVPLRVSVSAWTVPDPRDFRVHNFIHHSEEALAFHYGVSRWSDRHFDLVGKSLALLAEVNSRCVHANLAADFHGPGSNAESLVRWIRKPDSGFTHDYTILDKYLDAVARSIGKPFPLRLNCWGEWSKGGMPGDQVGATAVSLFDPATGKIERMPQPTPGTEESLAFWRPVLEEMLKKVRARGWLDATALGYECTRAQPSPPSVVDVARKLWPEGVWYAGGHSTQLGLKFESADKSFAMPVRYVSTVWNGARAQARGYRALLKPRDQFFCYNYRERFNDTSPLTDLRRIAEDMILSGHDGVSDFGADLFPLKKPAGGYYALMAGRGMNWAHPGTSTLALLAPGPDGPVATERFEMFREGVELAEAILFIERAIQEKKLSDDLQKRANRYLDQRSEAFIKGWFGVRYIQAEEDAKLLDLAGEVAKELQ
jgi:hypothetical protein